MCFGTKQLYHINPKSIYLSYLLSVSWEDRLLGGKWAQRGQIRRASVRMPEHRLESPLQTSRGGEPEFCWPVTITRPQTPWGKRSAVQKSYQKHNWGCWYPERLWLWIQKGDPWSSGPLGHMWGADHPGLSHPSEIVWWLKTRNTHDLRFITDDVFK